MESLIFQLRAPLASWGEVAVGEYRPSAEYPSQSAILGLLGAALGIDRMDAPSQAALQAGVRLAVGVLHQGRLLRDYHTTQVPSRADLKKRPHATRRDELSVPKQDLNTILSSRDYRQDSAALVALQTTTNGSYSLEALAESLRHPRFVLYLGRKSCPPAEPLHPCIIEAGDINTAFSIYQEQLVERIKSAGLKNFKDRAEERLQKIVWGAEFGENDSAIGLPRDLSTLRKDQVIARQGWQFADRPEYIAVLAKE